MIGNLNAWKLPALLLFALLVLLAYNYHTKFPTRNLKSITLPPIKELQASKGVDDFRLDFIPRNSSFRLCEYLFPAGTKSANFSMSDEYKRSKDEHHATLVNATLHKEVIEGHSFQVHMQYRALHYIGSSPHVRRICETGFNAGHSSLNWLTSNELATVHSFDLGNHKYAHIIAEYLSAKFKNRLFVTFGSSVETIPKFSAANRNFRCDIIYVDGGHSYEIALADLINFIPMARSKRNLIIIDDYPGGGYDGTVGRAWNEVVSAGKIKELMRCNTWDGTRGFCVGTVVN